MRYPMADALPIKQRMAQRGLSRPRNRVIAGVCAGLARRFGMAPAVVRVLFAVSIFLPGPQFLVYIARWILMPNE